MGNKRSSGSGILGTLAVRAFTADTAGLARPEPTYTVPDGADAATLAPCHEWEFQLLQRTGWATMFRPPWKAQMPGGDRNALQIIRRLALVRDAELRRLDDKVTEVQREGGSVGDVFHEIAATRERYKTDLEELLAALKGRRPWTDASRALAKRVAALELEATIREEAELESARAADVDD